jgi:fatty acid desaturase
MSTIEIDPSESATEPTEADLAHLAELVEEALAENEPFVIEPGDDRFDEFGREMDRLREEVLGDLGQRDADYIRRVIAVQRRLEVGGRLALMAGVLPPAWILGTAMLATSKILENMEIGHNVMHGQWDWMRDPEIHSTTWEWDNVTPSSQWKHTHNEIHHTWNNVFGMDRDIGYGLLRVTPEQRWTKGYLPQPIYATILALLFQWGVGTHDCDIYHLKGDSPRAVRARAKMAEFKAKARKQVLRDYVLFPALAGPFFLPVLAGNLVANAIRNVWAFTIIFCGHFPDGAHHFTREQVENETRGQWYARQMAGSANISGSPLLHLMSGNLSHQIEHHAFPDMPSNRYREIAPRVRALCKRHGVPYATGSLPRQFGQVVRTIVKLSFPGKKRSDDAYVDTRYQGAKSTADKTFDDRAVTTVPNP